jgi:hypothetical protein
MSITEFDQTPRASELQLPLGRDINIQENLLELEETNAEIISSLFFENQTRGFSANSLSRSSPPLPPQTAYLIRHGEKPADGGDGLTTLGQQRAQCLRTVFGASSRYNIWEDHC